MDRASYATADAIKEARDADLSLRWEDWRAIMLAITDTMATDPPAAPPGFAAAYVGPVRDGERWRIHHGRSTFDALWAPDHAWVYRVIPPRPVTFPSTSPTPRPRPAETAPSLVDADASR